MKNKFSARDIALMGVMLATIEAAKLAMAYLPNIELVTLLIILYTLFFGNRIYYVLVAFVLVEGCLFGFGIWWVMYVYIWPILAFLTNCFRRQQSVWFWSILSGAYGLLFGALCSIPYIVTSGLYGSFAYWVAGIPFDIVHCISNFILCMVLFMPLRKALFALQNHVFREE